MLMLCDIFLHFNWRVRTVLEYVGRRLLQSQWSVVEKSVLSIISAVALSDLLFGEYWRDLCSLYILQVFMKPHFRVESVFQFVILLTFHTRVKVSSRDSSARTHTHIRKKNEDCYFSEYLLTRAMFLMSSQGLSWLSIGLSCTAGKWRRRDN